jgi:predicted alpha-1,6-mannanase (GH76 family)
MLSPDEFSRNGGEFQWRETWLAEFFNEPMNSPAENSNL